MTDKNDAFPTIIPNPDGTPAFAVLPWETYETLRDAATEAAEEAADLHALAEIAADPLEGDLPGELVKRFLAGENPVRLWRTHRGMTATALAAAAGISQSYLSQIETGEREGTMAVMSRIAGVLTILLDDLAPPPVEEPGEKPDEAGWEHQHLDKVTKVRDGATRKFRRTAAPRKQRKRRA